MQAGRVQVRPWGAAPEGPATSPTQEEAGSPTLREEKALRPGFNARQCRELLAAHAGEGDLMLVGHEPDLSGIVALLTGGDIKLSKAALAAIELPGPQAEGRLLLLVPAKLLIRLYR